MKETLQKAIEKRRVIYKKVKLAVEHCPVCNEMLQGNNSINSPYQCSCGIWKHEWTDPIGYFYVIPVPLDAARSQEKLQEDTN